MTQHFMKHCISCKQDKPLEEFSKAKHKNDFREPSSQNHTYCLECRALKAREWRAKNPGYKATGRVSAIPQEDRLLMSAIRHRASCARQRTKKFNQPTVTVNDDYLYNLFKQQNGKCALTGVIMSLVKDHPHGLSLDKIKPELGYIEGNVQWLTWAINRAKGDLATEVFIDMCQCVLKYQKVQRLSNGSNTENLVE